MISKERLWAGCRGALRSALGFTVTFWGPMLAVAMFLPWPRAFGWAALFLFLFTTFATLIIWNLLLSVLGVYRRLHHGVWRPGWKPCMCDMETYCFRHNSSYREFNRPGVVAAKLRERE